MQEVATATATFAPTVPELVALQDAAQSSGSTVHDEAAYANAALAALPRLLEVVRATGLLYFRDDVVGCVALGRDALRQVGIDTPDDYVRAFGA